MVEIRGERTRKEKYFIFQQIHPRKGSNETLIKSVDSWTSLFFLFQCNTFKDINVLKCLVCERVDSLAPKGVMELIYIIKPVMVTVGHGKRFHFYIAKFLKVPVDKRNNTFQRLHRVIDTHPRGSTWPPQFGFIW